MRTMALDRPPDDASDVRIAIVASDYYREIYERLLQGAKAAFLAARGSEAMLTVHVVDGVFDIPPVAAEVLHQGADAVVVLGCVVRGETRHDRHIVAASFGQLSAMAVSFRRPVALGILTVESNRQAIERSGGKKGDAGAWAMRAAIRSCVAIKSMRNASRA